MRARVQVPQLRALRCLGEIVKYSMILTGDTIVQRRALTPSTTYIFQNMIGHAPRFRTSISSRLARVGIQRQEWSTLIVDYPVNSMRAFGCTRPASSLLVSNTCLLHKDF